MLWRRRRRPCAECTLDQHDFCLRKRFLGRCYCHHCWFADLPELGELVPAVQEARPAPEFVMLGWRQEVPVFEDQDNPQSRAGTLVFQSATVTRATFERKMVGYETGWRRARLPVYEIKVTLTMRDFTQLWGKDFPTIMRHLGWVRRAP